MAKEVKSVMLHTFKGGKAVLITVDEDYGIDTLSGDADTLRFLVGDRDLPNFVWRHASGDPGIRTVDARGGEYLGRVAGHTAMNVVTGNGGQKAAS